MVEGWRGRTRTMMLVVIRTHKVRYTVPKVVKISI